MFIKKALIYSSVTLIIAGVGAGLACSIILPQKYNTNLTDPWSKVSLVYDTNNVNDKSFNQAQKYGVEQYEKDFNYRVKQFIPGSSTPTTNDYLTMMETMIQDGSEGIISATFQTSNALIGDVSDYSTFQRDPNTSVVLNNQDKYFMLIDDASLADYSTINWGSEFNRSNLVQNGISLVFDANNAGFIAGLSASVYSTNLSKKLGSSNYVSAWGGMMFNNVYDWLSGYEQAINWFNYAVIGVDPYGEDVSNVVSSFANLTDGISDGNETMNKKSEGFTPVQILNGKSSASETIIDYSSKRLDPTMWYTNSFNPGDGEDMAANLIGMNANVIFPVAGPQVGDALGKVTAGSNTRIIGVDIDQANVFPDQSNYLLGSATKNLEHSVELGMWYTERYIGEFNGIPLNVQTNGNAKDKEFYDKYIDTTSSLSWVDSTNLGAGKLMGVDGTTSLMTGTYENGGVGWTDSIQNNDVEESTSLLLGNDVLFSPTSNGAPNLMDTAFTLNTYNGNTLIEIGSPTFTTIPNITTIVDETPVFEWIPDWINYI